MTTADTIVANLIINKLTQDQYEGIENPSSTELYLTTDEPLSSSDVTTALGYTPAEARTTVTDTTSTTITLANANANTDYHYGTLTSLTVTANDTSDLETTIYFTAGNSITVSLPATLEYIGEAPTFEINKSYAISILNNIFISGEVEA